MAGIYGKAVKVAIACFTTSCNEKLWTKLWAITAETKQLLLNFWILPASMYFHERVFSKKNYIGLIENPEKVYDRFFKKTLEMGLNENTTENPLETLVYFM